MLLMIRKLFQERKECNDTGLITVIAKYVFLGQWIDEFLDMKGNKVKEERRMVWISLLL